MLMHGCLAGALPDLGSQIVLHSGAALETLQGCKALFAAPLQALPLKGSVTLRLRRGHAFSQDVTMTTTWLQERRPPLQQVR